MRQPAGGPITENRKRAPWRLRTRLALALLIVIVPLSALVVASHRENLSERRDQRVESLEEISQTIAAIVDGFTRDLERFSLATAITLQAANAEYNQDNVGPYFKSLTDAHGLLRAIFLTDTSGSVIASDSGEMNGFDLSGRNYIQALQEGDDSAWSGAVAGSLTGQTTLAYARTIRSPEGTPRYFFVIAFYPQQLADRIAGELPSEATVVLLDNVGRTLYTSLEVEDPSTLPNLNTWPIYTTVRDGEPIRLRAETTPLNPDEVYGAFVPTFSNDWVVGLTVPKDVVDGPLESRFRRDLLIISLLSALSFAIMWIIALRLSQPLSQLAATAGAIARGERPSVPIESADADVRQLEAAIAAMSQAIAEREERLENQTRVLQALDRVGAALATELDFNKAVASISEAAVNLADADQAALFLKSPETQAGGHEAFELLSIAGRYESFPLQVDDPLLRHAWSGDIVYVPDLMSLREHGRELRFPVETDDMPSAPIRSLLGTPLLSREGSVDGVLFIFDSLPDAFDEYAQRRIVGLTRRATIVIENAKLFSQSQAVQEQLREAASAKDEFLALISHELRTPITTIYGGARLLQSRGANLPPEATAEMIASLEEESERLHRLVEDLLAIARSELGRQLTLEPMQLQQAVDQVVRQYTNRRPNRPIEITSEGDPSPVLAESTSFRQVIHNLLSNADKYSEHGLPIEVRISGAGEESIVRVLDRGPGVPESELERIFDRFYRSNLTARQAGGKGLGLTVCKRLVEGMSGRIWAQLREGGGLEVGVALRTAPDTDQPAQGAMADGAPITPR
jgi:signal transduction histidine kinase